MTLRFTPLAEADIDEIAAYIEQHNPLAAQRWVDRVEHKCISIATMPGVGVAKPEVRQNVRIAPMGNYPIIYREITDEAEIVRVLHRARKWQALL